VQLSFAQPHRTLTTRPPSRLCTRNRNPPPVLCFPGLFAALFTVNKLQFKVEGKRGAADAMLYLNVERTLHCFAWNRSQGPPQLRRRGCMWAPPRAGRGRSILCLLCVHTQVLRSVMASPAIEDIPVHRLRWRDASHVLRQFVKVPTMDMHKGQVRVCSACSCVFGDFRSNAACRRIVLAGAAAAVRTDGSCRRARRL